MSKATVELIKSLVSDNIIKVKTKSALAPLLNLLIVLIPFNVLGIMYIDYTIGKIILSIYGFCIIIYLASYIFMLFKNTDLLRSEEFQLKKFFIENNYTSKSSNEIDLIDNNNKIEFNENLKLENQNNKQL